jgi:glycosyltransferase involved in cell wall biosynthesis
MLAFASIRKGLDGATLKVFSGMGIYGDDQRDEYSSLYDLAKSLPGVTYVGPLSQARLAQEMSQIDIWAYPCTFAETSCISAMEAMTSGCLLLSTTLGALPETTAGHAQLMDMDLSRAPGVMATSFAEHCVRTAAEFRANPQNAEAALDRQMTFARTNYRWEARAAEWVEWLKQIV